MGKSAVGMGRFAGWWGVLGWVVVWVAIAGKTAPVGATLSEQELGSQLTYLLTTPPLSEARVGVSVVRVSDGREVFSHDAEEIFIPASNQKLLVSAAALGVLGEEYRFRTEVYSDGAADGSGVIEGNLYVKGYGDPTLARTDLQGLVEVLRKEGMRAVSGDLVVDESYFCGSAFGSGWLAEDEDKVYAAPASALSLEGNLVKVVVRPGGRAGEKAKYAVDAASRVVVVENDCVTGKKGSRCWTSLRRMEGDRFRLSGRIAAGHGPIVHVATVRDGSLFAASVFGEMLKAAGIQVKGETRVGVVPEGAVLVAKDFSARLTEILVTMNKNSENHYAEQILRTLGAEGKGVGDWLSGAQVIEEFLSGLVGEGLLPVIHDGSGLSPENLVRPMLLTAVLVRVVSLPYGEAFVRSLAIGGVDGTLKRRLKGSGAEGRIYAKTGTLKGVSGLSGYVMGKEGPVLAFSVLINGFSGAHGVIREAEDRICGVMWEYGEGEG